MINTPPYSVRSIKAAVNPAEFYPFEILTMPATNGFGWVNGGLCPFHSDRRAGSFFVNVKTGAFKCFSCGAKGGDIISFVMKRDGLTFRKALNELANHWGI